MEIGVQAQSCSQVTIHKLGQMYQNMVEKTMKYGTWNRHFAVIRFCFPCFCNMEYHTKKSMVIITPTLQI